MSWTWESIKSAKKIEPSPQRIALAFRKEMRRRHLSQLKLAQQCGLGLRSLQLVLDGQSTATTFWTIASMAAALEIDMHYLAGLAPASRIRRAGEYVIGE